MPRKKADYGWAVYGPFGLMYWTFQYLKSDAIRHFIDNYGPSTWREYQALGYTVRRVQIVPVTTARSKQR